MSSQIVTLGPSVTSHLASDTGEDRGCPRHRPVSPDLAPSLPRLLSVSALRAERSDQSPSRHLGHNLRELGSLKAKSNHFLLDFIVIPIVGLSIKSYPFIEFPHNPVFLEIAKFFDFIICEREEKWS